MSSSTLAPRHRWSVGLSGLLFIAGMASVHAAGYELPPLNSPPSAEHHVGKVIWTDLVTPDLARAERFYGSLFGWTYQTYHLGASEYALALHDGRPVGGLVQKAMPAGERRQPAWLSFLAVSDVDAAKQVALAGGATVLSDAKSYPKRGRQAVLADPEGAIFAVLASNSGDPEDFLAEPGEWIWSSWMAKDPDTEAAFYQQVFGYDVFDVASDDGVAHVILSSDDYARASANAFPPDAKRRHPHWLGFVRVENAPDVAAKAVALGGKVLVPPHVGAHGGRVALIADPEGAPFGIMEWTNTDTKVEPK